MNASIRPWPSVSGSASWLPIISSMYFTMELLICRVMYHRRNAAAQG